MADKVWLNSYPAGVPGEVDVRAFSSVRDILEKSCSRFRDRPAYANLGVTLTFGDLDRLSRDFAAYLQTLPSVKPGERVAIMMPNLLQYPVALFGVLRAGLIVVNVNPLYTARELEHQLKDSGARVIVVLENFAHTVAEVIRNTQVEHVITTQVGDMVPAPKRWLVNFVVKRVKKMVPAWDIAGSVEFNAALARGQGAQLQEVPLTLDDVAFLQYTGGTTGVAKGAMLTHGNIVANMQQAHAWIAGALKDGEEIVITALPLYHIFCLTANCLVFTKLGGLNVLITNPRDMPGFVAELRKWRFTVITGVNTLFNGLMNNEGFASLDFSGVKLSLGGGAAVQKPVAERWKQVTGSSLVEAFGMTETSPAVSINPMNSEWNGTIGLPLPNTEVSIRDDLGNEVPTGQDAEICVRGPQVMKGYWQLPRETADVMLEGGWLKTGDIGHIDARGYVTITDRKKDMILVSGFNVYPNEIEGVVAGCPGVLECAAVGIKDERSGEAVKLVVVRKDPALTKEAILEYCKHELTGYKMPKVVEFRDSLPKTPIGKILRRELRDK
ncbi:MAG: long-chain-fatty-acid--CoA ligase [Betaproteobacteria bacterium]|nr:long-chain-fatty-acid--CoA ligase [Betaproteobacteria bacterium]